MSTTQKDSAQILSDGIVKTLNVFGSEHIKQALNLVLTYEACRRFVDTYKHEHNIPSGVINTLTNFSLFEEAYIRMLMIVRFATDSSPEEFESFQKFVDIYAPEVKNEYRYVVSKCFDKWVEKASTHESKTNFPCRDAAAVISRSQNNVVIKRQNVADLVRMLMLSTTTDQNLELFSDLCHVREQIADCFRESNFKRDQSRMTKVKFQEHAMKIQAICGSDKQVMGVLESVGRRLVTQKGLGHPYLDMMEDRRLEEIIKILEQWSSETNKEESENQRDQMELKMMKAQLYMPIEFREYVLGVTFDADEDLWRPVR